MKIVSIFFTSAAVLSIAYLGLLAFAKLFATRLMFARPQSTYFKTDEFDFLKIAGGENICALFLEKKDAQFTVLYCHGNGEDLGMIRPLMEQYREKLGVSILSFDYCGYGASEGKSDEKSIYLCADAAWKFLVDKKKIAPEKIIIVGYSLGSAAATHLASIHSDARGVILIGGIAQGVLTILPFNPIPWDIMNNLYKWNHIKIPVLIMHGKSDMIVPVRNALAVYRAANVPKRAVLIRGCSHTEMPSFAPQVYWSEIKKFIKEPKDEKDSIITI